MSRCNKVISRYSIIVVLSLTFVLFNWVLPRNNFDKFVRSDTLKLLYVL